MGAFQMPEAAAEKLADAYLHRRTNADRIRSMTDEELAAWIVDELIEPGYNSRETGIKMWLDWLRKEEDHG